MVKALTWIPDKLQILGIKKDTVQSLHSVLSVNEGGVLVNPDILAPVLATPFSVKSHTGGLHLHPAFAFEPVRYYTNAAKAMTTVREGAVTLLGTGVAGNMVFNPVALLLEITTPPGSVAPDQVLTIDYDHGALLRVTVYYQINGGEIHEYQEFNATGTFDFDTAGIVFNHGDVLTIVVKDSESTLQDTVDFTAVVKSIIINSLNNGDPFYFEGEFIDGTHYFFTNDERIVPASDPDITQWYAGLGNVDGDIDLDIKQLRIYDVDSPANVQLDTEFNVTGNYVLLGGKIVVYASASGVPAIKVSTGEYVQCADGTFTISITLPSETFSVNTVVTIVCNDYETYGLNGSDTSNTISTITITNITGVTATVAKIIGGSFNGVGATVKYKLHSEPTIWTTAGSATVDTGADTWSYSLTIPVAGTYDIGVFDSTNPDGNAVQENIVVASAGDSFIVVADFNNTRIKKHAISDLSYVSKNGVSYEVNSICATVDYIFYGTRGGTYKLGRKDKANYGNALSQDTADNYGLCSNGTYIYMLLWDSYSGMYINRYALNLTGQTRIHTLAGFTSNFGGICHYNGYLYYVCYTWSGNAYQKIRRVNLADNSYTDLVSVMSSTNYQNICTDGTNLFLATASGIFKLTMAGASTGISYAGNIQACEVVGDYVFVGLSNDTIKKLNKSDLSLVSSYGSTGSGDAQFNKIGNISIYKG